LTQYFDELNLFLKEQDETEEVEFVNMETRLTSKGTELVLVSLATKMASNLVFLFQFIS
jgi:hypothetical protein